MPQSMSKAIISLLPKPGKDPMQLGSYRPISLLNCDYKILSKILALRLEKVVPSIIHFDQVGFVPGRSSSNNMRKVFHVLLEASHGKIPAIAASLDAVRAFDYSRWPFLFYTLEKFGFGPKFNSWIKALYSAPVSSVRTNGLISNTFPLQRGVRQGCPISPLLFIIALEPLACAIRASKNIQGIDILRHEFKMNMYADDILVTLVRPKSSVPALLSLVDDYGKLSGYKINWNKSEVIPLNVHTHSSDMNGLPFVWKPNGMKYLGVNITSPINKIFMLNGPIILQSIKEDLKRWSSLPLSLWGRVDTLI